METRRLRVAGFLCALVAACSGEQPAPCEPSADDLLISDARVIDGTGAPAFAADVRISNGTIAAIGDLETCGDESVVDGGGNVLAPGFIDTHSHADGAIFEHPDALNSVSQGITTAIVGQDGGSPYPLREFIAKLEETGTTINIASYVGHNTLRSEVLGEDYRVATEDEVAVMAEILRSELETGALGLSTGLEYEPGIYSDPAEPLALARVAADAGGRYISHMRSEDRWLEAAVDEIIEIGRETGMPVQISHFKLAMRRLWGEAPNILAKLDAARSQGVDITADIYPYEYWQSTMMVLLPERDYTDRSAVEYALDQMAPPEGVWMTRFTPNPEYVGKTIAEIAALRETDPVTAFMQLAEEADRWQREHGERAEMIIGTSMHADDIATLMSWPHTNICSDGGLNDLHPRGAGSFPRVLGRYVREQGLFSLEEGVHKMTGLTAAHMGFSDRGVIREGAVADLVLFDPDTISDHATPADPGALSEGILSVWVAGELVYTGGRTTAARPGVFVRRTD